MSVGTIWKLFAGLCKVLRWITQRKPRKGVFLIVEDDPDDAEILEIKIRKRGWKCEVATSGEAAAGLLKHTFYPVAFVDMRLPTMSGEALLRLLSRDSPDTNVVICCGEPRDLEKIPAGQFVCVLRKPPTLEAIEDLLNKLRL